MKKKHILIAGAIAALAITAAAYAYYGGDSSIQPGTYDDFAKCLSSNGVTMYGTSWCHVCSMQKDLFGDSFQYVNYVECTDNPVCTSKGIASYPTWEINGMLYVGLRQLQALSNASGCQLQ